MGLAFYFQLQFTRIKRRFEESGINHFIGLLFALAMFVFGSELLFHRTEVGHWILPFLATWLLLRLGDRNRNDQLRIIFLRTQFLQIRFIENAGLVLPFSLFLVYKQHYLIALGTLLAGLALVTFQSNQHWGKVIPTPFKRFPFEFIVGFRKSLLFLILTYALIFKAIEVGNFNLAIVAFCAVCLTTTTYYLRPEDSYFVWIFSDDSSGFLKRKMRAAIICSTVITTPALIALCIAFPSMIVFSLIAFLLGFIFLCAIVLAKYAAYPNEIGLPQGTILALGIWIPPLLLLIIPMFYAQAKRSLNTILK